MKLIRELRHRHTWEQPKSSNPLPIIFGALLAFGLGLLGISGVIKAPQFVLIRPKVVDTATAATSDASARAKIIHTGTRGRAENAQLLSLCMPLHRLGMDHSPPRDAGELYRMLSTATGMMRVMTLGGLKSQSNETMEAAVLWADVADCIYKQNGWRLCDADNRALAAEVANFFVRQLSAASRAGKWQEPLASATERGANLDYRLRTAEATRSRVMSSLRQHVADGRMTASDFGMFAPAEVLQAVRETKVMRNSCEERI